MDTFFARNRLSAYLDGELSAAEAREVEAAISRDAGLRAELEQMRSAIELLRAEGLVSAPVGFAARVRERVDEEPMRVGWRLWVTQIRPEAVMLAAAALLVVVYVGHRREHPPAAIPGTEAVATGGAFGGDEGGVEGNLSTEPAAEVQAAAPPVEAEDAIASGSTLSNDGVLGNELPAKAQAEPPKSQSLAERLPKPKAASAGETVEPWQPEWEKETVEQAPETMPGEINFYAPAPFRYRVTARDGRALKTLAAIAAELGGELQDSRGRPVAAWSLEEGDSRSVRVAVPAYNAAALAARLREVGEVETIVQKDTLLADPNADVPVQVELLY